MKKRTRYWVLTIAYGIVIIVTLVAFFLQLIEVANTALQGEKSMFGPWFDVSVAYIFGIVYLGVLFVCEYGTYSSLRYFLTEEREGTGRLVWEIVKLVISLPICVFLFRGLL